MNHTQRCRRALPGPAPTRTRRRSLAALATGAAVWVAAGMLAACGEPPAPTEEAVRQRIAEAEAAAEEKQAGTLVAMLADEFVGRGHTLGSRSTGGIQTAPFPQSRQSAAGAIHAVLAGYRDVHLLTRVRDLAVDGDATARATVFVAMSASPIAGPEALTAMEVALYRFDVTFESDGGDWLVTEATWRRAQPGDFL